MFDLIEVINFEQRENNLFKEIVYLIFSGYC